LPLKDTSSGGCRMVVIYRPSFWSVGVAQGPATATQARALFSLSQIRASISHLISSPTSPTITTSMGK
jgi:hypothetical protein